MINHSFDSNSEVINDNNLKNIKKEEEKINGKQFHLLKYVNQNLEDSFKWEYQLKNDSFSHKLHSKFDWEDNLNLPLSLYLVSFFFLLCFLT